MTEWKYWTPERDGHAPDDWVEGMEFEYKLSNTWYSGEEPLWAKGTEYRYRPLQDATVEPDCITRAQYESAVKGRQDFRNAYRSLLPVLRAAEELSRLWRTKGQRVDDEVFFNAINAVDVAVTGGGAKPDPEHLARPAQDEEPDLLAQCLRLPQDQRDALIEAMQKPQRDWADDVAAGCWLNEDLTQIVAARVRSACRPKEVELSEAFLHQRVSRVIDAYGACGSISSAADQLGKVIREALS